MAEEGRNLSESEPQASPFKVLSVVSTLWRCGPVNVLNGIVLGYDPRNYAAIVATLSPNPTDSAVGLFRSMGIPLYEMDMSRSSSMLHGSRRLRRILKDLQVDLVHCHGFRADLLVSSCDSPVPTVSTLHSELMTDYRLSYGNVIGTLMARRQYAALQRFSRVVAVSKTVAETAKYFNVHCDVIANGIDLKSYYPAANHTEKMILRDKLKLPKERTIVLHCGALIELKRPLAVITGFRKSDMSRKATLVLAGEGQLRPRCEQAASGADNVVFLGKRSDMAELLRASDLLISNSHTEGSPMALLEACACGLRIIASDIPAHRDIQKLFPSQMSTYAGAGSSDVSGALDAHSSHQNPLTLEAPSESLDAISSRRMSHHYQRLYKRLL